MLYFIFCIFTAIWLGLFIAWIVYAIKAHKAEKIFSFSDKAIKYNMIMSKCAVWLCMTAMIINILNIVIHNLQ